MRRMALTTSPRMNSPRGARSSSGSAPSVAGAWVSNLSVIVRYGFAVPQPASKANATAATAAHTANDGRHAAIRSLHRQVAALELGFAPMEFCGGARKHHRALAEHEHLIAHCQRHARVLLDEEDGDPLALDSHHHPLDLP